MHILKVYRMVLMARAQIATLAKGGIHIGVAPQDGLRPNIVLKLGDAGQDLSHQGPTLSDAELVVVCRADSVTSLIELSASVKDYLQVWRGSMDGVTVQLTTFENAQSGYDDAKKVFEETQTYTAIYGRSA